MRSGTILSWVIVEDNRYIMNNINIPHSLEEIEKLFDDSEIKVISFDMFDTLVNRPIERSEDLFLILDKYYSEMTESATNFRKLRIEAESFLRRRINASLKDYENGSCKEDVTLLEIYEVLVREFSVPRDVADLIMQKEYELELEFSEVRKCGKSLLDAAVNSGRTVIITSDMYLTKNHLIHILSKNGFMTDIPIYVSSDIRKRKITGNLYKYILSDQSISANEMLHIGDNMESDCNIPAELGIKTVYLPSSMEAFKKHGCYTQVQKICRDLTDWEKASQSVGMGISRRMSANLYFDNPFQEFADNSDYNADPYLVGFSALGMEALSLVRWLAESAKRDGVKKLIFLSRDGYLPKLIYDRYRNIHPELPESDYIYASRLSLLPAMLRTETDFFDIPTDINYQTPGKLLKLLSFCDGKCDLINDEKSESDFVSDSGFKLDDKLDKKGFQSFIRYFLDNRYDKNLHEKALSNIKSYFDKAFDCVEDYENKVGIFDMGYSGRIPAAISSITGVKPSVYFFHTDTVSHYQYEKRYGFKVHSFFDFNPYMESSLREYSYLEVAPSCVSYDDAAKPLFDKGPAVGYAEAATAMQRGAIDFVDKYLELFGKYENETNCRYHDGALPFEAFLRFTSEYDKKIYDKVLIDDELWGGRRDIDLKELMEIRLGKIPDYASDRKNADAFTNDNEKSYSISEKVDILNDEKYAELRKSIINWYEFKENADILFIDDDFDSDKQELCNKKYDYIVDVYGYGKWSINKEKLKAYQGYLKEGGTILFSVENRFGLKAFCGANDPYTGIIYDGINGYLNQDDKNYCNRCYSKKEVCRMLEETGITTYKFYYPVPDSRMPQMIYTDDYIDAINSSERLIDYTYDDISMTGIHHRILPEMISSGALGFMADSFLVEATLSNDLSDIIYAVPTTDRGKTSGMATTIRSDGRVVKRPLYPEGEKNLKCLYDNMEELKRRGVPVVGTMYNRDCKGVYIEMPFVGFEGLSSALEKMPKEQILSIFDRLFEYINKASDKLGNGNLKKAFIDIAPCNAFYDETKDQIYIYDQEFIMEDCPAEYAMYRTIRYAFQSIKNLRDNLDIISMYLRYGIDESLKSGFEKKEEEFIDSVRKKSEYEALYKLATPDYDAIYERMQKITALLSSNQNQIIKSSEINDEKTENKTEQIKPYKVGYVPGVFDLFHTGHLILLEKCKARCEHLIVGILTDELVEYYKGKRPVISYEDRARVIEGLKVVDEVIPVDFSNTDKLDAWEQLHYDCHFSGDDHVGHWNDVWEELKKRGSNMEFFPYTQGISSTQIRNSLGK